MPRLSARFHTTSRLLLAVLLAAACGGDARQAESGSATPSASASDPQVLAAGMVRPVQLTERDVESFLGAARDLHQLGLRVDDERNDDPSSVTSFAEGLKLNAEAMGILRRHGFDLPRFQQVTYSVMMAAAAGEMEPNTASADMNAQLEAMKAKLSPEQYEQMKQATAGATATMKALSEQPEGNIELVKRYKEQIKAISEGK
jgi:hypothetical protein